MSSFARKARRRDRRSAAGFTLIELLVVLVILGLLAAFAAPQVLKYLGRAKTDAAKAQVQNIGSILDLYRLESPEQVFELGWEEARADGIALVEWAERLGMLLPAERLTVTLAMEGDGRRADLQGDARFGDF